MKVGREVELHVKGGGVDPGEVGWTAGTSIPGKAVTGAGAGVQAANKVKRRRYRKLKMGLMKHYGVVVKWAVGVRVGVGERYHIEVRVGVRVGGMTRVGVTNTSGGYSCNIADIQSIP